MRNPDYGDLRTGLRQPSDIGGALNAGLGAILVRTGKYRSERVHESGIEPTAVVDSIADVPDLIGCSPTGPRRSIAAQHGEPGP